MVDLGADSLGRGRANPLELDVDLCGRAAGRRAQEVGRVAARPREYDERPKITRVGDPLQRGAVLTQPGAVRCPPRRVGDRARKLDHLARRRSRTGNGGDR
jgi:hypothetical protein